MSMDAVDPSTTVTGKLVDGIGCVVLSGAKFAAQHSLGQSLLKLADRFLWVVEKSAQWSLPVQDSTIAEVSDENGESFGKMELVRPLPWIIFLPGLVILRTVRVGLSIGAFILGFPKVQPTGMVRFIQKGRRRLRAIKSTGLKDMKQRKSSRTKEEKLSKAKKSLIRSMLTTLSCLSDQSGRAHSPSPTRIHVRNDPETKPALDDSLKAESHTNSGQTYSKRKYSQVSGPENSSDDSEDETLRAKIDRLAAGDSSDEQDFDPEEVSISEDTSSTSGDENDVSLQELRQLQLEAVASFRRPSVTADVISEEQEPTEEESQLEKKNVESTAEENIVTKNAAEDHTNLETSSKAGPDSETVYYSPISSKSASPERNVYSLTTESDGLNAEAQQNNVTTVDGNASFNNSLDNSEMNYSTASNTSGNSVEGATKDPTVEKRHSGSGKGHSKGKRSGNANRKRK